MKRTISLALCLVLLLGLAACGGNDFEDAMAKAQAASAELKSMHVDMDMNMAFSMSAQGQSVDMPISMSMAMDVINEPLECDSTVSMNMFGTEISTRSYVTEVDGSYMAYASSDGGATWLSQPISEGDLGQYDAAQSLEFYLSAAESFSLTGADDMVASTTGAAAPSFEGSMPMTIWLDSETFLPLRYDLDMGEIMTSYMQQSVDESQGVTVDSVTATVSMRLSNFDGISDIATPEGVA